MDSGGPTARTVTIAVSAFPSLTAINAALPAAIPVTTPEADTVATGVASDVHVTAAPLTTAPDASRSVAVNATDSFTARTGFDGVRVRLATVVGPRPTVSPAAQLTSRNIDAAEGQMRGITLAQRGPTAVATGAEVASQQALTKILPPQAKWSPASSGNHSAQQSPRSGPRPHPRP